MLEQWNAVSFRGVLQNGRTKPLIVECAESANGIILDATARNAPRRREFVVKAVGNPEVDRSLILKELLGNVLARRYGLNTPEPALIQVSDAFARAVNPILKAQYGFQITPGIAAGCEYFKGGFSAPPTGAMLTAEELRERAILYGFDLVTQNPDRLPLRPNCGMKGSSLIAFDFDQCFSFLYMIAVIGEPWEISKHGIASKHLCHPQLKATKTPASWTDNVNAVASFSDETLALLSSWIPDDWNDSAGKIRAHIAAIRQHLGAFELELQGSIK